MVSAKKKPSRRHLRIILAIAASMTPGNSSRTSSTSSTELPQLRAAPDKKVIQTLRNPAGIPEIGSGSGMSGLV